MSFRKRSVRPNLNLSKRLNSSTSEKEVDNKYTDQIPNDQKPQQKKSGEQAPVTDLVSKQEAQLQLDPNKCANNKTEEPCNSPTLGKRLTKRAKVAPKLTQQKKALKSEVSEFSSTPVRSQPVCSQPVCSTIKCPEKTDTNQIQILIDVTEPEVLEHTYTINETVTELELLNSPTVGKRLSKHAKFAPKLTQQKKTLKSDVSEFSSTPVRSQPSTPVCSTTKCPQKTDTNQVQILIDVDKPDLLEHTNTINETVTETKVFEHYNTINEAVNQSESSLKISGEISVEVYLISGDEDTSLRHENSDKIEDTLQSSIKSKDTLSHTIESKDTDALCLSNDSPKALIVTEIKPLKRTRRVMPNLKTRPCNRKADDIPKEVGKEVGLISNILSVKDPPCDKQNDINKQDNQSNISKEYNAKPLNKDSLVDIKDNADASLNITSNQEYQDVKCNSDIKEGVTKTSRLQKRVKVRPKLKSRISNATTCGPSEKEELACSDTVENESINTAKSLTTSDNKGIKDLVIDNVDTMVTSLAQTISTKTVDNEFDKTKIFTIVEPQETLCIVDNEYINSFEDRTVNKEDEKALDVNNQIISIKNDTLLKSDIVSDKKELKHVRFTADDDNKNIDCNDNSYDKHFRINTRLSEISSKPYSPDNSDLEDESAANLPNRTENTSGKYDSNDECDSMSEGDVLGKQLVSKNKVFKPNLGAKRRERLSSFSAYSSCDEEDWQNQKRRKKEKGKNKPEEIDEKDEEKKEERKKKLKKPGKPKKDRENVEPNVVKPPKKRKKKANPEVVVPPKSVVKRDLSNLTMQELIHYNHPSFKTVELRSKREEDENERVIEIGNAVPDAPPDEKKLKVNQQPVEDEVMAPQIMINEDGEIVINQESLTISQKVDASSLNSSAVVYEDSLSYGTHLKRKHVVGKRWKIAETLRFYKALSEIGTDFTLMSQAFGRFSRNELKKKFKKEEKVNCDLVDRALSNRLPLNMEMFLQGKEEMKDMLDENKNKNAGTPEVETPEAGTPEAGTPEAGTPEAGTPEAETPEAETPETETPEVKTPEVETPELS